uniref:Uncharacterized protein n=1 Tax=Timema bartmani TaxID=61472 RepID=A0A7R9I3J0_9NEOP|nr:unnamed protein product [Timema bartmani]
MLEIAAVNVATLHRTFTNMERWLANALVVLSTTAEDEEIKILSTLSISWTVATLRKMESYKRNSNLINEEKVLTTYLAEDLLNFQYMADQRQRFRKGVTAICIVTDKGVKVTVEDSNCIQASAFIQAEMFQASYILQQGCPTLRATLKNKDQSEGRNQDYKYSADIKICGEFDH